MALLRMSRCTEPSGRGPRHVLPGPTGNPGHGFDGLHDPPAQLTVPQLRHVEEIRDAPGRIPFLGEVLRVSREHPGVGARCYQPWQVSASALPTCTSGCGMTRQEVARSAASRHSSSTYLDVVSGPLGRYGSAAANAPQPSIIPPIRPRSYLSRSSASPYQAQSGTGQRLGTWPPHGLRPEACQPLLKYVCLPCAGPGTRCAWLIERLQDLRGRRRVQFGLADLDVAGNR